MLTGHVECLCTFCKSRGDDKTMPSLPQELFLLHQAPFVPHERHLNKQPVRKKKEEGKEGGRGGRGGGSGMCVVFFVKSSNELERISQSVTVLLRTMMMKRRRIDHQQWRRRKRRICYELVTIYASDHDHSTSTRRETPQNVGTPNWPR